MKWWRKCIQPVGNKYEGSGNVRPANKVEVWEKAGGLVEVCQLHNDAPPRFEAEYINNFHYMNAHGNQGKKTKTKRKEKQTTNYHHIRTKAGLYNMKISGLMRVIPSKKG